MANKKKSVNVKGHKRRKGKLPARGKNGRFKKGGAKTKRKTTTRSKKAGTKTTVKKTVKKVTRVVQGSLF